MYRLWGIIRKNNKTVKDVVSVYDGDALTPDECLHYCIQEICYSLDLQRPIWLKKNQREYVDYRRVILNQDNFIEEIDFDTLELEVLDEEK